MQRLRSEACRLPPSRASWAHYFQREAEITAGLIVVLPGASSVTQGTRPATNAALLAAGLDPRLGERVTIGVRLESELSANTRPWAEALRSECF